MNTGLTASANRRIGLLFRMHARPLLWRMMVRLGIEPGETWWHGSEGMIERIVRRCQDCTRTTECRSWLERSSSKGASPVFCRNRRTLAACRILAADSAAVQEKSDHVETEPSLSDLFGEPIVTRLMAADGVDPCELWRLLRGGRPPAQQAH